MTPDARSGATLGRVLSAATIAATAGGLITLIVIGRSDHLGRGVGMFGMFALAFGALGWLIIPGRHRNPVVWVPASAAALVGVSVAGWATSVWLAGRSGIDVAAEAFSDLAPAQLPPGAALAWSVVILGPIVGFPLMVSFWPLWFPDGALPSPRWRWPAGALVLSMIVTTAASLWVARPGSDLPIGSTTALQDASYTLMVALAAVCAASLIPKYRRGSGELRQQIKWLGLGTLALLLSIFIVDNQPWTLAAATFALVAAVACYAIAVTKHRLYDIDIVISRAFVYGTLAVFIGAVYVTVVVGVGGLLGTASENLVLALAATALVAMAFEPVRRMVQRWANLLVYGRRATPYEVLSALTRRLSEAEPTEGLLDRMAVLMSEGTGAEQATVWLTDLGGRLTAGAGFPPLPHSLEADSIESLAGFATPVLHDGELVGALEVAKTRGNPVSPNERRLLQDLAGSAGLVMGNQRLLDALQARAEELRTSRRRLVQMQDAERRRLERDLHDGAQQQVVAIKLEIGLAEHMARRSEAEDLAELLAQLAAEAQEAVDDIRGLARGIYPPLLESQGLVPAIRSEAARSAVAVEIIDGGVGRYSKDTESAAYFTVLEATANAARHAKASLVQVTLGAEPGILTIKVSDDGIGFDPRAKPAGPDLVNMRDRVEALGGELTISSEHGKGTEVTARIPIDGGESA